MKATAAQHTAAEAQARASAVAAATRPAPAPGGHRTGKAALRDAVRALIALVIIAAVLDSLAASGGHWVLLPPIIAGWWVLSWVFPWLRL